MTKRLFICEKNQLSKAVSEYLSKKTGLPIKTVKGVKNVGDYYFVTASGHLFTFYDVEDYQGEKLAWHKQKLPFIPQMFKKKLTDDRTKKLFNEIKIGLSLVDEVIHFGDPDDEGQRIVDDILDAAKNTKPVSRFWCGTPSDSEIEKAFKNLKNNTTYHGLNTSSTARSQADWVYGINLTIAATTSIASAAKDAKLGSTGLCSMGRVQSAILAMIDNRVKQFENFTPVNHYVPSVVVEDDSGISFTGKWRKRGFGLPFSSPDDLLLDKNVAIEIINEAKNGISVSSYTKKPKIEHMPLPFNLSTLQIHMANLKGYSAVEVLQHADAIRLRGYCTYVRTDWEYVNESDHLVAPKIVGLLRKNLKNSPISGMANNANITLKSHAFNDKKVGSHPGIVPTDNDVDLNSLNPIERDIYLEICKRYLLQFYPVAEYNHTEIVLKNESPIMFEKEGKSEEFTASGREYTKLGWKEIVQSVSEEADKFPVLKVGQLLKVKDSSLGEAQTKPLPLFTVASLTEALSDAHKYVIDPKLAARLKGNIDAEFNEDGLANVTQGIGTQATRASIVDLLGKRGFIELKKAKYYPTEKGRLITSILPSSLKTPDKTAIWQMQMDELRAGKGELQLFMDSVVHDLDSDIKELKVKAAKLRANDLRSMVRPDDGKKKTYTNTGNYPQSNVPAPTGGEYACPSCKSDLALRSQKADPSKKFWGCTNWKNGCKVILNDNNGTPVYKK